jgi:hypothetical protein
MCFAKKPLLTNLTVDKVDILTKPLLTLFYKKMILSSNCISGLLLRRTFDFDIPIILPNILDFKFKAPHNRGTRIVYIQANLRHTENRLFHNQLKLSQLFCYCFRQFRKTIKKTISIKATFLPLRFVRIIK